MQQKRVKPPRERDWVGIDSMYSRLQSAAMILANGKGKVRDRLDQATQCLVPLLARDFPKRLQGRAKFVLGCRAMTRVQMGTITYFDFERIRGNNRRRLIDDIMSLYEACVFDLGRLNRSAFYPSDRTKVG